MTATADAPGIPIHERPAPPLWRNISFMLMWTSVAASGFGDRIVQLAAWELCGISMPDVEPAPVTAAITFFFMLPYVLFGLVGGWLADTLPRKWVMFACDEIRAGILLLAFVVLPITVTGVIGTEHYWKVYAIVFATGTLAAIFSPTKAAVMPQLVPISQLQSANAIVLGIAVIASMIGIGVGDWIIENESVRGGLKYAFISFAVSGTFFAFLKVRKDPTSAVERRGQIARLIEAASYVRRHRPIIALIVQSVAFWAAAHLFINAVGTLCKQNYAIKADDLRTHMAYMQVIVGIGMLSSAIWVAWINTRRESAWFALMALSIAGVLMFWLALNRSFALGMVLAFGTGFFGNTAMIVIATLTQSITPNYIRGRVFGVRDIVITITAVIVNLVIWQMPGSSDWMIPALIATSIVLAVGCALGCFLELSRGPLPSKLANAVWRISRAFMLVWHRLTIIGKENVPHEGAVILAANHTTALDPIVMQCALPRIVRFVMLQAYRMRALEPVFRRNRPIFLSRDGKDTANIRQIVNVLSEEQAVVGLFPEGGLQRDQRVLQPFQPGIGMIARRSGAVIVPTWIHGTPLTKSMLLHFIRPSRTMVIFGTPYVPDPAMKSQEIVDDLRQRLIALSATVNDIES